RFAEFEVVPGVVDGGGFTHGVEHHEVVLAAGRDPVDDDVGDRHVRLGQRLLGLGLPRLGGLDLLGEFLGTFEQCRTLVRARLSARPAGGLLFGAQVVGRRHRGAAGLVGGQQCVDEGGIFTTGALRRPHHVRVLAKQLEVDHGRHTTFVMSGGRCWAGRRAPFGQVSSGRHNPITLHFHHLSHRLTRLSQWTSMLDAPGVDGPGAEPDAGDPLTEDEPAKSGQAAERRRWWRLRSTRGSGPRGEPRWSPRQWLQTPSAQRLRSLQATPTSRALLLTALGGLLIAGTVTAVPDQDRTAGRGLTSSTISLGARGNATFDKASSGDCLTWPD